MAFTDDTKVTAVSDASFLIGLCLVDHFHLLSHMVKKLYLAPAVWDEVITRGKGRPGVREIQAASIVQKCDVQNVHAVQTLKLFLDPGESESIILAQEIPCAVLFVDDLKARRAAQEAGVNTMGVAGFLLAAKLNGYITQLRPLLEDLQQHGFRLSRTVINAVLKEAGERILIE